MKSIVLTLFIATLISFHHPAENKTVDNVIVLELFTSQGCSSCPPADKLLNEVKNDNVIVLSYHVDYWNYIGWKDPFSKSEYSDKQRLYGAKFNSSSIYTPQLVINGKEHIVGSDKKLLKEKISKYSKSKSGNSAKLSNIIKSDDIVNFDYNIEGDLEDKYIRMVLVINERSTTVKRGENRNRELTNTNIVIKEQRFKLDENTGKGSVIIPDIVKPSDDLSLIVIIENKDLDITTANQKAI